MIIKFLLSLLMSVSFAFDPSVLMISQPSMAARRSEHVSFWKDVTVEKGFVLSTNIQDKRYCNKVWPKQIPSFKEMNPQVVNVDKFYPGDKITIQVCGEDVKENISAVAFKSKESVKKKKVEENEDAIIPAVPVMLKESSVEEPSEEVVKIKSSTDWDDGTEGNLYLGLGFLSENHNDLTNTSPSLTFRVRSGFHPSLNHRLMMEFAQDVIYVRNKIDFKTTPSKYQYFLSVGMGNRIGTKARNDVKLSDKISTYLESSLGFNLKYSSKINITMEMGVTANSKAPLNFSAQATKQLGNSPYYLGGYFDYVWTDSSLLSTDTNDRRMITGGMIFSY